MKKHLLFVVDDEADLLEVYKYSLSDQYEVVAFSNPKVLIETIEGGRLPDLIITDLRMGAMNGIQLIEWARSKKIERPFIIVSGHSEKSDAIQALKLGAVDLIEKPFSRELLQGVVRHAVTRSVYSQLQSDLLSRYKILNQTLIDLAKNYEERSLHAEEELMQLRLEGKRLDPTAKSQVSHDGIILEKVVHVTQEYIRELTQLEAEMKRAMESGD